MVVSNRKDFPTNVIERIGRLRLVLFALLFVSLSVLVPVFLSKGLGGDFHVDYGFLSLRTVVCLLGLLAVYFCCDGLRLYYVLRSMGHRIPLGGLAKLVFVNIFFSNITPMATGGGFAQIWYLRRLGVPLGTATAATTLRTFLATVCIFGVSPFLLLFLHPFSTSSGGGILSLGFAFLGIVYLFLFCLALLKRNWMIFVLHRGLNLLCRAKVIDKARAISWRSKAVREIVRFSRDIRRSSRGGADILLSVAFTAVFLMALFSFPFFLLRGTGYPVPYLLSVGLLILTTFIMYFSPTPGGAGFAEGLFGLFFLSSIPSSELVSVIVIWRFLTIYLGMGIGFIFTLTDLFGRRRCDA